MSNEYDPNQTFKKKFVLIIIRIARRLFYNTPVHRSKVINVIYEKVFHAAFKEGLVQVTLDDLTFKIPSQDITILPSLLNGCYEQFEIALLKRMLRTGMTFVDVGANVGLYTVIASRLVGESGKVYAFEPEPKNFHLLKENLSSNNSTNVQVQMLAVGNQNGHMTLHLEKNSVGTHSLINKHGIEGEQIMVDTIKLDDWFANVTEEIDLLKIDVEGYEPFVLEGSQSLLHRTRYVVFEYNKSDVITNNGIRHLLDQLRDFPYLYGIDEKHQSLMPFTESDFSSTNYINILASKSKIRG